MGCLVPPSAAAGWALTVLCFSCQILTIWLHMHPVSMSLPCHMPQVVLAGLNLLLPLMSHDLLTFPKLPRLYFSLLAYVLENYPEQVRLGGYYNWFDVG